MQKIENIYLERKEDGFNVVILYNGEQVVIAGYERKEKALYPEPAALEGQEGNVVIALKWTRKKAPCPGEYHIDKSSQPNTYCGMCGEGLSSVNAGAGYRPCW